MSLNESIVEDAALEWFLLRPVRQAQGFGGQVGELGYAVGHGPNLAPGEYAKGTLIPVFSQREKEEDREAIRQLNPANSCGNPHLDSPTGRGTEARATIRRYLRVRFEGRLNP